MLPKQIILELTNSCNSNCVMCLRRHSNRLVKHMELELIEKVILEIKNKKMSTQDNPVGLCGIGEPTLHPQLKEALSIIKQVPFGFGTNCENLTPEVSHILIESKFIDFNLSIDSMFAESHNKIKPGLSFYNVFKNARYFLDQLRAQPYRFWRSVTIQFIVLDLNVNEVRDFILFWLNYIKDIPNTIIYIKPICKWPSNNGDNQHYPSPRSFRKIEDSKVLYGDFNNVEFRDSCTLFNSFVQIQSDGSYSPCCMNSDDEYKVGNIKNSSIEELFNSSKMNYYRDKFDSKNYDDIPFCRYCSSYELQYEI